MAARSERTLRELIRVIAGRFLGMLLVFLLVVAAAGVATWHAPKWYRSELQLLAKPSQIENPLDASSAGAMRDQVVLYISTLRALASSNHVLGSTLMRLEGKHTPPPDMPSKTEELLDWGVKVDAWDVLVRDYVVKNAEKVDELRERLSIVTPGGPDATFTQTLRVQVIWPEERKKAKKLGKDPQEYATQRALEILNCLTDAYRLRDDELEWKRATAAATFLKDKSLAVAKLDLDAANKAYTKFITEKAGSDLGDMQRLTGATGGGYGEGIASLATSYAGEMTTIAETIAGLASLKKSLQAQLDKKDDDAIAVSDSIMAGNPSVRALEAEILRLKLNLNGLIPRYTEDHKEVVMARAELAAARKEFRNELSKQLMRIQQKLDSDTARRDTIKGNFDTDRARLKDLGVLAAEWHGLQDARKDAQRRYISEKDGVMSALTAAELSSVSVTVTRLSDPSKADPDKPLKPVMLVNMILAVIGGLILALIYAFSADHFDHSLKSIDDAERYLGVPVLASIPKLGRRMIRAKGGV
jgi:uncharacterized protein involved in exopolysaccharide biosynthesis